MNQSSPDISRYLTYTQEWLNHSLGWTLSFPGKHRVQRCRSCVNPLTCIFSMSHFLFASKPRACVPAMTYVPKWYQLCKFMFTKLITCVLPAQCRRGRSTAGKLPLLLWQVYWLDSSMNYVWYYIKGIFCGLFSNIAESVKQKKSLGFWSYLYCTFK